MSTKPKVNVYSMEGKVAGEREMLPAVFGVTINPSVVHEVLVGMQANARHPWAHTKTRGDVRGGGKKPWKQKGTGRARQGSTRSPIWVGGGITFGPRKERDYSKKINRMMKRSALCMSFSDKVANERLILVESLTTKNPKTKEVAALLKKLPTKGKLMLVIPQKDEVLTRTTRNLKNVLLSNAASISMVDVLKADFLVMTPQGAEQLERVYGKSAS